MSTQKDCTRNHGYGTLTRRGLFKLAASAALALALVGVVAPSLAPQKAYADAAPGTYTVTANLYAGKADTPIGQNAYLTNSGNPPLHKPVTPVANNAQLEVRADGTKLLSVPIVNNTFGLLTLPAASTDGLVKVVGTQMGAWKAPLFSIFAKEHPAQRITSVTFDITSFAAGSSIATLSPSSEYVAFPLYQGGKSWDIYLSADLSAAGL